MHNMISAPERFKLPEGLPPVPTDASAPWLAFNPLAWLNDDEDDVIGLGDDMLDGHPPESQLSVRSNSANNDRRVPMENEDNDEVVMKAKKPLLETRMEEKQPDMPETPMQQGAGNAEDPVVSLGKRLNIRDAEGLRQTLVIQLSNKATVRLDGSMVESADASALQLLTAFYREASHRGVKVHWHEPSEALLQSAALLGLSEELDLPRGGDK